MAAKLDRDRKTRALARLLKEAKARVIREWGQSAYEKLGTRIQRALLAESVLILAASQDGEGVGDDVVRLIVEMGWSWTIDETEGGV